ncbi:MAG: hypothetical protein Q9Q40_04530 [Acidobacteriota bacterium]|nr:hypothetical protein [Acidobacteriota bacterium]MDQ7088105.1 hypothetical protein [Acidobacteriota bacterium]
MAEHPSFDTLQRATRAWTSGRRKEALALAEAAWHMVQEIPGAPPQAALVESWYGYLQARVEGKTAEGLERVRQAAKTAFWEPQTFVHLAELELLAGSRRRSLAAIRRGLALSPDNKDLVRLRKGLGLRRRPPLGFLDRAHPLNRLLGQLRHRGEISAG